MHALRTLPRRALDWLRAARFDDPIDQRNALTMQLLLLAYAVLLPANWVWQIASNGLRPVAQLVLAVDMVVSLLALVGFVLLRLGRFRPAVTLFIGALLSALTITFALVGVQSQLVDPAPTMLCLAIAGLVLGRRALWTVWALLLCAFAIGFYSSVCCAAAVDRARHYALGDAPAVFITYTLVTIILDRTVAALRENLAEARRHQAELQREMLARERAQAQLLHAQKMEATGRLASGIAHDFQNVLDVVLGFSRERHQDPVEPGQARERFLEDAMEGVELAAQRGSALTRKLLSFARLELSRPVRFDAVAALDGMRPLLRQLFPPDVRIEAALPPRPREIVLDQGEFQLMLLNLAANARDAMPDGGRFGIDATADDTHLEIALSDTGQGIEAVLLPRIFEPFFTTKAASGGTGLGLSVIHDLVAGAGGTIAVDSVPGAGTTFRIRLPLAGDAPAPRAGDALTPVR